MPTIQDPKKAEENRKYKAAEFSKEIYHLTAAQLNLIEIAEKTTRTASRELLIAMWQEIQRRLTVLLS